MSNDDHTVENIVTQCLLLGWPATNSTFSSDVAMIRMFTKQLTTAMGAMETLYRMELAKASRNSVPLTYLMSGFKRTWSELLCQIRLTRKKL